MEISNYDAIRQHAMRLAALPDCPEVAQDFLIRMVADQKSLTNCVQAFAIMTVTCQAFNDLLEKMAILTVHVVKIEADEEDK